jgi:hypothetical protein
VKFPGPTRHTTTKVKPKVKAATKDGALVWLTNGRTYMAEAGKGCYRVSPRGMGEPGFGVSHYSSANIKRADIKRFLQDALTLEEAKVIAELTGRPQRA